MGLVFCGMLWCYCFTDFVKSLYCYCQNGGKTTKTLGSAHGQTKSPDISHRPPNLLVLKWAKKKILAPIYRPFYSCRLSDQASE